MYKPPDVDEVVAVAKELGINLGPDEAVKYQNYLIEQMEQLDTFTIRKQNGNKRYQGAGDS